MTSSTRVLVTLGFLLALATSSYAGYCTGFPGGYCASTCRPGDHNAGMSFCESSSCCIQPGWKDGDPDPRFLDDPKNPPVPRDFTELPEGVINNLPEDERPKTEEEQDEFFRKYTNNLIENRKAMGTYRRSDFAEVRGPHVRQRPDCKKKRDGSLSDDEGVACKLPAKKASEEDDEEKPSKPPKNASSKNGAKKAKKVAGKVKKGARKPRGKKVARKPRGKKGARKPRGKGKRIHCKKSCAPRYRKANGCCMPTKKDLAASGKKTASARKKKAASKPKKKAASKPKKKAASKPRRKAASKPKKRIHCKKSCAPRYRKANGCCKPGR